MKNNGKIIFLIILLTIIVFFLTMFLVTALKNGSSLNGIISIGTQRSSNIIFEKSYDVEAMKNITINQDAGDIIFEEATGDDIQVTIYGEDEDDAKVDFSDGMLNIVHKAKKSLISFSFNVKQDIIIYIPSNYAGEIKIKNDYGDCKITDLENASMNIDYSSGDIELGKIKNAVVNCDYGDVKIKEVLNKCEIKENCGDIKVDKISIKEDSEISVDYGDISIEEVNDIYVDAEVDFGDKDVYTNNRQSELTLKIRCSCGDIKVK